MDIKVGSNIIKIDDGASEEAIAAAIDDFRTTDAFAKSLDTDTGAAMFARAVVGTAPEQDKLANVQRFYPDAVPFGEGNFVFENPDTGKLTLFNPPGLDIGDVPGTTREIAGAVGGTIGAIGGGLLGTAGGPPGVIGAGYLGAGLGQATGEAAIDAGFDWFAGMVDTRTPGQRVAETATSIALGAVGQRGGELISMGTKGALLKGRATVDALVQAYGRLNVPVTAGVVGNASVRGAVKGLESMPTSAGRMERQATAVISAVKSAADDIAVRFGTPMTEEGAGGVIKSAAKSGVEVFEASQEAAYDAAYNLIGRGTPALVRNTTALRLSLEQRLAEAPQSLKSSLAPVVARIKMLEADAAQGGIAFDALREIRTAVGREIKQVNIGSSGRANAALKQLYASLSDDLSDAAKQASPDAAAKLQAADRYTRQWMKTVGATLDKVIGMDADNRAFDFAYQAGRDGGIALQRLRRAFQPEEWDTVAGSVLHKMGLANAGAQDATGEAFSVNTFLTNWSKLAPEGKEALFGGSRYADIRPMLDDLVAVTGSLKELERFTNSSRTAIHTNAFMSLQTLVGGLVGYVSSGGSNTTAALGALGTIAAPNAAARLMTSPRFLKWLVTPVPSATGLSVHVARLAGIAEAEPELRDAISWYVGNLRQIGATEEQP